MKHERIVYSSPPPVAPPLLPCDLSAGGGSCCGAVYLRGRGRTSVQGNQNPLYLLFHGLSNGRDGDVLTASLSVAE